MKTLDMQFKTTSIICIYVKIQWEQYKIASSICEINTLRTDLIRTDVWINAVKQRWLIYQHVQK